MLRPETNVCLTRMVGCQGDPGTTRDARRSSPSSDLHGQRTRRRRLALRWSHPRGMRMAGSAGASGRGPVTVARMTTTRSVPPCSDLTGSRGQGGLRDDTNESVDHLAVPTSLIHVNGRAQRAPGHPPGDGIAYLFRTGAPYSPRQLRPPGLQPGPMPTGLARMPPRHPARWGMRITERGKGRHAWAGGEVPGRGPADGPSQ